MIDKQLQIEIRTAIKQDDADRVELLLSGDPVLLNATTVFGTWLHFASSLGKLSVVKRLVDLGADVNAYGGVAGGGPLHRAASDGHYEVVAYLIEKGAVLDASEPERNPLFGAIHNGHSLIAKLLVEKGIDSSVSYTGDSMKNVDAIVFAKAWGRTDIVELLEAKKRDRHKI